MKWIIVIDNLNTGGVATALYNYINYASKYVKIDLLVFDDKSIDLSRIPKNITLLNSSKTLYILGKKQKSIRKESLLLAFYRIFLFGISKIIGGEKVRRILWPFITKIRGYDLAISYAQDDAWNSLSKGCNDFVRLKVDAKYKVAVIHCDYASFGGGNSNQEKGFKEFNYIICLSESCKKAFISQFPNLKNKCIVCENFINEKDIIEKSEYSVEYLKSKINFVTIARLSPEKGIDRAILSFAKLLQEGINNFTWTIVGDGPQKNELTNKINELKLNNYIKLVGNKENPYPYLKNATVFLLTSYNEAAPMVYGECAVLNIPIITTETCSAVELVKNRCFGIVCKNEDDFITEIIKKVLIGEIDLKKYSNYKKNINQNAIAQFQQFLLKLK